MADETEVKDMKSLDISNHYLGVRKMSEQPEIQSAIDEMIVREYAKMTYEYRKKYNRQS